MTNDQLGYGSYGGNQYNTLKKWSGQNVSGKYANPLLAGKGAATNKNPGMPTQPQQMTKMTPMVKPQGMNVMKSSIAGPMKQVSDNLTNNMQRGIKQNLGISVPGLAAGKSHQMGVNNMLTKEGFGGSFMSRLKSIFQESEMPIQEAMGQSDRDSWGPYKGKNIRVQNNSNASFEEFYPRSSKGRQNLGLYQSLGKGVDSKAMFVTSEKKKY